MNMRGLERDHTFGNLPLRVLDEGLEFRIESLSFFVTDALPMLLLYMEKKQTCFAHWRLSFRGSGIISSTSGLGESAFF